MEEEEKQKLNKDYIPDQKRPNDEQLKSLAKRISDGPDALLICGCVINDDNETFNSFGTEYGKSGLLIDGLNAAMSRNAELAELICLFADHYKTNVLKI